VRTHSEEPTARPLSGPNVFPSEELVPGFKACMNQYFAHMLQLGRQVAALLAEGLHLHAGAFNAHMFGASSMSALKLLKYPAEKSDAAKGILGTGAHSDYGLMTFLVTDATPGLEVLHEGVWQRVVPRPKVSASTMQMHMHMKCIKMFVFAVSAMNVTQRY
jgi:isopenicillin N synthase-like dioxygenase